MDRRYYRTVLVFGTCGGLAAGVVAGVALAYQVLFGFIPPSNVPASAKDEFRLLAQAWNLIELHYVDRKAVQARKLTYGSISGLVNALGDTGHSGFLSPDMVKEARNLTTGGFEGIGAEVQMRDERVVIVAPMDGSPAQRAGLKPGDVILEVDGADVSGLPLEQVVARILGRAGTKLSLTILSGVKGTVRTVRLTRARIVLHNVSWGWLPGTHLAHVRIASFSRGVGEDLRRALDAIGRQRSEGLILDLRNDPGGLLDEAVAVASQFLEAGNVLLERDARGKVTPIPVELGPDVFDAPMVVLVNEGSASAAEIVAGALQDARRGRLVGATTFGTGTVLNQFLLSDGSALLLATQEWLTPSGRTIWHQGVKPDVAVALAPESAPLVPAVSEKLSPTALKQSRDHQLLAAVRLLSEASPKAAAGQ